MSELKVEYLHYAIQELRKSGRKMAADNADWQLEALLEEIERLKAKPTVKKSK